MKLSRLSRRIVLLSSLAWICWGCQGAVTRLEFASTAYPVSMSPVVPGADGRHLKPAGLRKVGRFAADARGWSLLWTLIPLNTIDLSEELNRAVKSAKGEAVTNLRVSIDCPTFPDVVPGLCFLFHWIPLFPGSVHVAVTGDIVRARKQPPPVRKRAGPRGVARSSKLKGGPADGGQKRSEAGSRTGSSTSDSRSRP
ncbi:hypothetical protein ACFL59_12030 [Planctomycetota bacterium]